MKRSWALAISSILPLPHLVERALDESQFPQLKVKASSPKIVAS